MELESGNFNQRVTIEQVVSNPETDVNGEVDLTDDGNWETYVKSWANIKTKGGREWWKSDKINAEVTHVIRVPYGRITQNIDSQMRIRLGGNRIINIVASYDIDEAHEVVEIQGKEPK